MEPIKSNGTSAKKKPTKAKQLKIVQTVDHRDKRWKPTSLAQAEAAMNPKELRVVEVIMKANDDGIKLEDIAGKAFVKKGTAASTKGNSWVRNSIRRPLRWGLVKKIGRGLYVYSFGGRAN
jgi:hypothetical protein